MAIVDVYNKALRRLGAKPLTTVTTPAGKEADLCNEFFQQTLDELIDSFSTNYNWSFAIARDSLTVDTGDNFTPFEYKFDLILDPVVMRVITLIDEAGETYADMPDSKYIIEAGFLYTDITPCSIKYLKQFTDVDGLPELFLIPLHLRLASKICMSLTKDAQLFQMIVQEFSIAYENAKQRDGSTSRQDDQPNIWWTD